MNDQQQQNGTISTPGAEVAKDTVTPEVVPPSFIPELNHIERNQVMKRTTISAIVIHEAVREEGERQLQRTNRSLAWSALAAGLSMGFSFVGQGIIHYYLPSMPWTPLIDNLGYSIGFLIVILGRQQLFTENTLTVILPLLAHPNRRTFLHILRLWSVVLVANLVGALIFATIIARTSLFPPGIHLAFTTIAHHSLRGDFTLTALRGVFAGWLIALMVWLLPSAEGSRLHIIVIITYMVALGGFSHIIAGSVDVLYLVNVGAVSWIGYLVGFMLPTLIGNIIGGVMLVAAINFAQVAAVKRENSKRA